MNTEETKELTKEAKEDIENIVRSFELQTGYKLELCRVASSPDYRVNVNIKWETT